MASEAPLSTVAKKYNHDSRKHSSGVNLKQVRAHVQYMNVVVAVVIVSGRSQTLPSLAPFLSRLLSKVSCPSRLKTSSQRLSRRNSPFNECSCEFLSGQMVFQCKWSPHSDASLRWPGSTPAGLFYGSFSVRRPRIRFLLYITFSPSGTALTLQ